MKFFSLKTAIQISIFLKYVDVDMMMKWCSPTWPGSGDDVRGGQFVDDEDGGDDGDSEHYDLYKMTRCTTR